jgi:hypothetical protein
VTYSLYEYTVFPLGIRTLRCKKTTTKLLGTYGTCRRPWIDSCSTRAYE